VKPVLFSLNEYRVIAIPSLAQFYPILDNN